MEFICEISHFSEGGVWRAHHRGRDVGEVMVSGASKDEVLEKMRRELRYRLELCPCTGESYQHIVVKLVEV